MLRKEIASVAEFILSPSKGSLAMTFSPKCDIVQLLSQRFREN
jgi:hypothetical protein